MREETDGETRARAAAELENDLVDVREMNSMVLYGKVMTSRDAQVEEKRALRIAAEAERRRLIDAREGREAYEMRAVWRPEGGQGH